MARIESSDSDDDLKELYGFLNKDLMRFSIWLQETYSWEHNLFGHLHLCLRGPQRLEGINNWLKDRDHGLAHGFMTAFWALRETGFEKTAENEKLLVSCLLHDYVRCQDEAPDHDSRLREVFPHLDTETYRHANPIGIENHPLVNADRAELMRFGNMSWIDMGKMPTWFDPMVMSFYRYCRPAFGELVLGYDQTWIRHGREPDDLILNAIACEGLFSRLLPEKGLKVTRDASFWPHSYWATENGLWAVETGRLTSGHDHINRLLTSEKAIYRDRLPYGLMRLERYKQLVPDRTVGLAREHLMLSGQIPLKEWFFATNEQILDPALIKPSMGFIPIFAVFGIAEFLQKFVAIFKAMRE